jgi:predicted transglutaminase-like cysteine proteinase
MTPDQIAQLSAVNTQINAIPFVLDSPMELPDTWKCKPDGKGFLCRDYVQDKAETLREAGWDNAATPLLTILCYDELGDYHAVLGVADGPDVMILDNRAPDIYRRSEPPFPYRWDRIQIVGSDEYEPLT